MVTAEKLQGAVLFLLCWYKCSNCVIRYCIAGHSNLVYYYSWECHSAEATLRNGFMVLNVLTVYNMDSTLISQNKYGEYPI